MNFLNTRKGLLLLAAAIAAALAHVAAAGTAHTEFRSPLGLPALATSLTTARPLNAVVQAGSRLIAAGQRGHIIYSDDGGQSWKQAKVPVSSDLTALWFSSARSGWAVGHEGVVLHTEDGGTQWQLQLDGHRVNELMRAHYTRLAAAGDNPAAGVLPDIEQYFSAGPDKPFLDIWFANDREGFVVGAFNMIFRTADGGKSWEPWFERIDNPRRLHLYAVRGQGDAVYIAGEQGLLAVLDAGERRFNARPGPYAGSFFGVQPTGNGAVVFGMRGSAYRIDADGSHWTRLDTGVVGGLTGAVTLDGGRLALVSTGGDLLIGNAGSDHFERRKTPRAMAFAGVAKAPSGDSLVLVGSAGLAVVTPERH